MPSPLQIQLIIQEGPYNSQVSTVVVCVCFQFCLCSERSWQMDFYWRSVWFFFPCFDFISEVVLFFYFLWNLLELFSCMFYKLDNSPEMFVPHNYITASLPDFLFHNLQFCWHSSARPSLHFFCMYFASKYRSCWRSMKSHGCICCLTMESSQQISLVNGESKRKVQRWTFTSVHVSPLDKTFGGIHSNNWNQRN